MTQLYSREHRWESKTHFYNLMQPTERFTSTHIDPEHLLYLQVLIQLFPEQNKLENWRKNWREWEPGESCFGKGHRWQLKCHLTARGKKNKNGCKTNKQNLYLTEASIQKHKSKIHKFWRSAVTMLCLYNIISCNWKFVKRTALAVF